MLQLPHAFAESSGSRGASMSQLLATPGKFYKRRSQSMYDFIAVPFFEVEEDKPAEDSCVQKKGFWLIDSAIPRVSQLPDNYRVGRYAKVAS